MTINYEPTRDEKIIAQVYSKVNYASDVKIEMVDCGKGKIECITWVNEDTGNECFTSVNFAHMLNIEV